MVISGVGNNMFEPDRDITRAEFAAIVIRSLGLTPGTGNNVFNDVKSTDYFSVVSGIQRIVFPSIFEMVFF